MDARCLLFGLSILHIGRSDSTVTISFYRMEDEDFVMTKPSFTEVLSVSATSYCKQNTDRCGLAEGWESWPFAPDDVIVTKAKKHSDDNELYDVTFYMRYNNNLSVAFIQQDTTNRISSAALLDITTDSRVTLHDEVGYFVMLIEDTRYHPPPTATLNKVIIPLSVLVVMALAAVVVWYQIQSAKREKEFLRNRQMMIHLQKSKSGSTTKKSDCTSLISNTTCTTGIGGTTVQGSSVGGPTSSRSITQVSVMSSSCSESDSRMNDKKEAVPLVQDAPHQLILSVPQLPPKMCPVETVPNDHSNKRNSQYDNLAMTSSHGSYEDSPSMTSASDRQQLVNNQSAATIVKHESFFDGMQDGSEEC